MKKSELRQLIREEILNEEEKVVKGKGLIVRVETHFTADDIISKQDVSKLASELHSGLMPVLDKITKKYGVIAGNTDIRIKKPTKQSGR